MSRIEYLTPSDNIVSYLFDTLWLTKKSNLSGRLIMIQ